MTRNAKALLGCFCLGAIVIAATGYVAAPSVDERQSVPVSG
jgi:hypothetical protein